MTNHQEIYKDVELWESRQLGADEKFVKKSTNNEDDINEALGLKPISIRLPQNMIDDLKAIAALYGIGYQPLMKQILARFIESEQKMLANELIRETLKTREQKKANKAA